MKLRKKTIGISLCAVILLGGILAVPGSRSLFAAKEDGDTQGDSYSDKSGLFLAMNKDGTFEYIDVEGNHEEADLTLPEDKNKNTKFELQKKIGDSDPITIGTYDSYAEADVARSKQAKLRSVGNMSILSDDQLRSVSYGVVNFAKKSSGQNTEYYEDGTNIGGYTNGSYAADGAYLETSKDGKKVKFKMAGVVGWVNKSEVDILNYDDVQSVSHYRVEQGKLYHYITLDVSKNYYASVQNIGPKQSNMKENQVYYSYDGHYFYTDYKSMINDYKVNSTSRAINSGNGYYNYFQYLSHRTKTNFLADDFNKSVNTVVGSAKSVMKNQGSSFISNQNKYGSNGSLMFGLATNESYWGRSKIALDKNNLFGHGAVDSNPYFGANGYENPSMSILYHAEMFVSEGYVNPLDWRYYGPHLGDKASGMNVKYASDPYWGEKAAVQSYNLEGVSGNKRSDYGKYTLGIKAKGVDALVYKEPTKTSKVLYGTSDSGNKNAGDFPFVILGEVQGQSVNGNTKWYKIQSDAALKADRNGLANSAVYDFNNSYAYVSAAYVNIVNKGVVNPVPDPTPDPKPDPTPDPTPTYKKGDVDGDGKITASDYVLVKNHVLGKKSLTGASKVAADVDGDNSVTASDYVRIKNTVLGK